MFCKWLDRIPLPFAAGRPAVQGTIGTCSCWQMEVKLDADLRSPLAAGVSSSKKSFVTIWTWGGGARPGAVDLRPCRNEENARQSFWTRVIQDGVHPSLHIDYTRTRFEAVLQGRARLPNRRNLPATRRIFGAEQGIDQSAVPQKIGRQINRRLLEVRNASATTAA